MNLNLQEEAKKQYIDFVGSLSAEQNVQAAPTAGTSSGGYETLICEEKRNISLIQFNRPKKKNAFTTEVIN